MESAKPKVDAEFQALWLKDSPNVQALAFAALVLDDADAARKAAPSTPGEKK